jgi:hypothetical protein
MDNWWQTERRYYDSQLSFNVKPGPWENLLVEWRIGGGQAAEIITEPNVQGQPKKKASFL